MPQTANNVSINETKINFCCVKKVKLFEDNTKKNRRFTPEEFVTELEIAKWMRRPPRTFINDPPFYPWLPPEPIANQPFVNFKLNFTE